MIVLLEILNNVLILQLYVVHIMVLVIAFGNYNCRSAPKKDANIKYARDVHQIILIN